MMPLPYHQTNSHFATLPPAKDDAVYFATAETVPIVQAENAELQPLVPIVYAEQVTEATATPSMNASSVAALAQTHAQAPQHVMGEEITEDHASLPVEQEQQRNGDHTQQQHEHFGHRLW